MTSDGKSLEALVAFVEKTLLPGGFHVVSNQKIFNDDGIQIAEFDIEIRGKVGTTEFIWLIECRDRPSEGPAPGSWIEQLVGRRTRFGFNKVTAVSTTGFTAGAIEFASQQGIELREVASVSPESFGSWLVLRHISQVEQLVNLEAMQLNIAPSEDGERMVALAEILNCTLISEKLLKAVKTGEIVRGCDAFCAAVMQTELPFDGLLMNGPGKEVRLQVEYPSDDHFVVETPAGPIRILSINFIGTLSIKETLLPLVDTHEYRHIETGSPISQHAVFATTEVHGTKVNFEFHKLPESGQGYLVIRRA